MMPFSLDVPLEQLFPSQIVLFWSSHFISKTTSSDFMSRQTAYMRMQLVYINENGRGELPISSTQKQEQRKMNTINP
jgi:hypothetical protein